MKIFHYNLILFIFIISNLYIYPNDLISKNNLSPKSTINQLNIKNLKKIKPFTLDISIPMIKDVRDVILKNKHFILKVMTNDFYVSSYVLTNTYRNMLSKLTHIDKKMKNELKRICYIIEQLEKISSLMASNIMNDINSFYIKKYGFIINDGIEEDRIKYVLFELLRNALVHAHNYDYTKKISIGWYIENDLLKIYVGDEKGGFTQNKLFFKLGISRFIDELKGKKKQLGSVYLEKILKVAGAHLGLKISERNFDIKIKNLDKGKQVEISYKLLRLTDEFMKYNKLAFQSA